MDISRQWAQFGQTPCAERVKRTVCFVPRVRMLSMLVRAALQEDEKGLFFCSFVLGLTERGASR